jgi:hypothetical protein
MLWGIVIGALGMLVVLYVVGLALQWRDHKRSNVVTIIPALKRGPNSVQRVGETVNAVIRKGE